MVGCIDLFGLFYRSVIQPEDYVVIIAGLIEGRPGDGDGLVGIMREDGERAGRIESYSSDRMRIDIVLGNGTVDGRADTAPYVCGRLFLVENPSADACWTCATVCSLHSNLSGVATGQCSQRRGQQCRQPH